MSNKHLSPIPKRRRVTQACDFCHSRGLRCRMPNLEGAHSVTSSSSTCLTCLEYNQTCTRFRGTRKRGPAKQQQHSQDREDMRSNHGATNMIWHSLSTINDRSYKSRQMITSLIDVYLDSIHPYFPLFCERQLWVEWRDGTFPCSTSSYAALIALCALSAQHVGKGALFNDEISHSSHISHAADYVNEYLGEAVALVSSDFSSSDSTDGLIDTLRSYGLLAQFGTQAGDNNLTQKYLGLYHGLAARDRVNDEVAWSRTVSHCEREVLRRIFWAMYRLEVHTASVQGHIIRTSETQAYVGYPAGLHHEPFMPGRNGLFEDWFSGWNATTEIYRVLEHAILQFRETRPDTNLSSLVRLGQFSRDRSGSMSPGNNPNGLSKATTENLQRLDAIQSQILPQFSTAGLRSDDSGRNRCGFQVTSIFCTIQLVKVTMYASSEATFVHACQTAQDLIETISCIPPDYFRAFGSPIIQQLSGVGYILCSAQATRLNMENFAMLKSVTLSIADLLETLDPCVRNASSASIRLKAHVLKLETSINISENS